MKTNRHCLTQLAALCLGAMVLFAACTSPAASQGEASQSRAALVPPPVSGTDEQPITINVWALSSLYAAFNSNFVDEAARMGLLTEGGYRVAMNYGYVTDQAGNARPSTAKEDAIDALITEMLAGGGPDVILMDGINAPDFAAQGFLMDLSAMAEQTGVYESLADSLKVNNTLYYVPLVARASVLVGDPDAVNAVQSIPELVALMAESGPMPWPTPDVAPEDPYATVGAPKDDPMMLNMPDILPLEERIPIAFEPKTWNGYLSTEIYAPHFVENGQVDTALLTEYFMVTAQLEAVATQRADDTRHNILSISHPLRGQETVAPVILGRPLANWYLGGARMAYQSGINQYVLTSSFIASSRNLPIAVQPLPGPGAVWMPQYLLAVNANAKNPQAALRFIEDMLSDTMQKVNETKNLLLVFNTTLPVTKSAMGIITTKQYPRYYRESYRQVSDIYNDDNPTDAANRTDFAYDMDALMKSFDTAYLQNDVVEMAVAENLAAVISGALTPEQAAAQCADDLRVYLNERVR